MAEQGFIAGYDWQQFDLLYGKDLGHVLSGGHLLGSRCGRLGFSWQLFVRCYIRPIQLYPSVIPKCTHREIKMIIKDQKWSDFFSSLFKQTSSFQTRMLANHHWKTHSVVFFGRHDARCWGARRPCCGILDLQETSGEEGQSGAHFKGSFSRWWFHSFFVGFLEVSPTRTQWNCWVLAHVRWRLRMTSSWIITWCYQRHLADWLRDSQWIFVEHIYIYIHHACVFVAFHKDFDS